MHAELQILCPECGAKMGYKYPYCTNCGEKLHDPWPQQRIYPPTNEDEADHDEEVEEFLILEVIEEEEEWSGS